MTDKIKKRKKKSLTGKILWNFASPLHIYSSAETNKITDDFLEARKYKLNFYEWDELQIGMLRRKFKNICFIANFSMWTGLFLYENN